MLKLLPLTFLLTITIACLDFFFIEKTFFIHQLGTVIIGFFLFYFSYRLYRAKQGSKYINIFVMTIGGAQFVIHFTLLFIGGCG